MADTLVVIRSGTTDYDLQGRIRGTLDIPLSTEGIAEARAMATALAGRPLDALYSASSLCAIATAGEIARSCGLQVRRIAELTNLDQGLWQGMLVDEIRVKQPRLYRQWHENPWAISPPEGELLEHACSRVEAVLEKLARRHAAGRIGLVVPSPLDRIVRWHAAGETLGDLWARGTGGTATVEIPLSSQWKRRAALEKARA